MAVKRVVLPKEPPKPPTSYMKDLRAAKLYANDIDVLLRFLAERAESVQAIANGSALIDAGNDLRDLHKRDSRNLVILTNGPPVEVQIGGVEAKVRTKALDSDSAKSLVDDVATLFDGWGSLSVRAHPGGLASVAVITTLFASVPFLDTNSEDGQASLVVLLTIAILVGVLGVTWVVVGTAHRVLVSSRTRGESQDQRLRFISSLLVGMAGGGVGAVFTYLLTK